MRRCLESGRRVIKYIGFDATEDHRTQGGGTYAVPKKMAICPEKGLPAYGDRYDIQYPLREWGFDRAKCGEIIRRAGLPIPCKSACFFCPAMRQIEILRLKVVDPDFYALAMEMERLYRGGIHFRGDTFYIVKAKHIRTGETVAMDLFADNDQDARQQFREAYKDTARPYQWKLRPSRAVPGLGRSFAWSSV